MNKENNTKDWKIRYLDGLGREKATVVIAGNREHACEVFRRLIGDYSILDVIYLGLTPK